MKIAISLTDDLATHTAALAAREGKSRSQIIAEALQAWIAAKRANDITAALNAVEYACADDQEVALWRRAGTAAMACSEW